MAKRIKPGKRVRATDGASKKGPARKPVGTSPTPKNKPAFLKGKKTAKRTGTS